MSCLTARLASSLSARKFAARTSLRYTSGPIQAVRRLHERRALPYPIEGGLGEFLPPEALKVVAVDFQDGLLTRLNDEVKGTALEMESVAQTVIKTSSERSQTLAFNYASLALNNSFFLANLKPLREDQQNHESEISDNLRSQIRDSFYSLDQMKSSFAANALGMISSGWVWLVMDGHLRIGIVPTFGAGTLIIRSRTHMIPDGAMGSELARPAPPHLPDSRPMHDATSSLSSSSQLTSPTSGLSHGSAPFSPSVPYRSLSCSSSRRINELPNLPNVYSTGNSYTDAPPQVLDYNKVGQSIYPLLCLSVHEHAWMAAGRGVWGKEEYLKHFWSVVDWRKISALAQRIAETPKVAS